MKNRYWRYLHERQLAKKFGLDNLKHVNELNYWQDCYETEGGTFENIRYRNQLLAMAGEPNGEFLRGKIVADFGCGPRGSLHLMSEARIRIGIDVLTDAYSRFDIFKHDMTYVTCTEEGIPLSSGYVDVLFTMNAMDHVDNFAQASREVLRILRPGGLFIGSFNLDEPPTRCEPQTLDEALIKTHLLSTLEIESYRVAPKGPHGDAFRYLLTDAVAPHTSPRVLWVRAKKPCIS